MAALESEIAALLQRVAATRRTEHAVSLQLAEQYIRAKRAIDAAAIMDGAAATESLEARLRGCGLFDPEAYVTLNPDLDIERIRFEGMIYRHDLALREIESTVLQ